MTLSSSLALLFVSRCVSESVASAPGSEPHSSRRLSSETTKLYGNINKYAYYFTDLYIGSPQPQRTSVIVDTGSRIAGFPCKGCQHCGHHIDAPFDVNRSETARWLRCGEGCTSGCVDGLCTYQETYSEGSSIIGRYFNDQVELGDTLRNSPVPTRLGCHNSEDKLFYTQKANGILGLAPMAHSSDAALTPTVLQDLFKDRAHVSTKSFSMCLATWGGRLTVGGDNAAYHSAPISWMKMTATKYYFIYPTAMSLDPQTPGLPSSAGKVGRSSDFGATIVDSGTTFTYFPEPLFNSLVTSLRKYCDAHNGCGAQREGPECWRLDNPALGPDLFPQFKMSFKSEGEGTVMWTARGYLHERGEHGVWCQTFLKNNLYQTVLGISWMLHKDVIFDLSSNRLGVADSQCPEYHREDQLEYEKKFEWVPVRGPRPIDVEAEMGTTTVVIGLMATLACGIFLHRLHRRHIRSTEKIRGDDFEASSSLADFEEAGYVGSSGPLLVVEE